jgi:hypothetical protein
MTSAKPKRRHLVSITLWAELESEDGQLQDAVSKMHLQANHILPAMGLKPHRGPQVVLLEEIKKRKHGLSMHRCIKTGLSGAINAPTRISGQFITGS